MMRAIIITWSLCIALGLLGCGRQPERETKPAAKPEPPSQAAPEPKTPESNSPAAPLPTTPPADRSEEPHTEPLPEVEPQTSPAPEKDVDQADAPTLVPPQNLPVERDKQEGEEEKASAPSVTSSAGVGKNAMASAAPAEAIAPAASTAQETITELGIDLTKPTGDWNQWGGTPHRNNTPVAKNIPHEWSTGKFDRKTGEWDKSKAKNIKWVARVGSQTYGNPVIVGGKVFVGTNNGSGYIKRYPAAVDLGCLMAFNEADGKFLWQHSSEKLPTGRVHDWPLQGICCSPYVEGKRLWFVTSRGEVLCLDVEGFYDGENSGDFKEEPSTELVEADVLWKLDMMKDLKVSQHNMCSCSITALGDILFICTSNGVDESHINLPAPKAPSFIAVDKNTGKVLWTDDSPGENILHGQWSSPAVGVLGGVPQVIFAGGDSWLYSFRADAGKDGKPELLWKFDANPKDSKYILGGAGTRNEIICTPVIYDGLVYVAVGQDPEHGEGIGHLWCIDPTKRGDISAELAFKLPDMKNPIPHRRLQAVIGEEGEVARANPNSGVVWHYHAHDQNGNGELEFEETMHRTCGTPTIQDDILYIADFSGLFHCVDAKTGVPYWTYDMLAASWGSPLIVDGKVYIGDEDGDLAVFKHGKEMEMLSEINMGNSVYSTPVVANGILYIVNKTHVFAITPEDQAEPKP